mmetsp:Transcript_38498/g.128740  ORF Transcript_38498/g.128740 Transcript_38498/m.128740 type:complete len:328 (-) Transcript_38498:3-986(-)
MLPLILLPAAADARSSPAALPPGKPANLTVLSGPSWASIRWMPSPAEGDTGVTNHFALKWQLRDSDEAEWFPYWVGPEAHSATLSDLPEGATIAARVAAVNEHGRAWSEFVVFSTTEPLLCDETHLYRGVLEDADIERLCGGAKARAPVDPHRSPCSVTHVEYAFAGAAAGLMIVLLSFAIVVRTCFEGGALPILKPQPSLNEPVTAVAEGADQASQPMRCSISGTVSAQWRDAADRRAPSPLLRKAGLLGGSRTRSDSAAAEEEPGARPLLTPPEGGNRRAVDGRRGARADAGASGGGPPHTAVGSEGLAEGRVRGRGRAGVGGQR